jgi:hypothetical protein
MGNYDIIITGFLIIMILIYKEYNLLKFDKVINSKFLKLIQQEKQI